MPMAQVKSIVFRYIMAYYNRERIYISNPRRATVCYVPSGRESSGCLISKFGAFILCTVLDFSSVTSGGCMSHSSETLFENIPRHEPIGANSIFMYNIRFTFFMWKGLTCSLL